MGVGAHVHVHLSLDNARDGSIVEYANTVHEELVARERHNVWIVPELPALAETDQLVLAAQSIRLVIGKDPVNESVTVLYAAALTASHACCLAAYFTNHSAFSARLCGPGIVVAAIIAELEVVRAKDSALLTQQVALRWRDGLQAHANF